MTPSLRRAACLLVLFLGTLLLFARTSEFEFLSYDDDTYVVANAAVNQGLSLEGLRWAFGSTAYACNWHPLTWISHMADVSLFGLERPGAHHLTNVVIHALNAVLLVLLFGSLSGRWLASWFVGAVFAWHPLRVESVAWVSERKDVLAICFGLACLLAFYRWVESKHKTPRPAWYLLACCLFACGLMAKPLLVTLPGCMLLLDRWPSQRILSWRAAWLEKLPFIGLSALACAMTLWSQSEGGCTEFIADGLPAMARIENALIACAQYLGLLLYPHDLVVFYPHPAVLDPELSRSAAALGALALWCALLGLAWRLRQRAPYLWMGLLWFLGVLFPMLGLVQVGGQALADRYTYFSTLGLSLPLVFGAADLAGAFPKWRLAVLGSGIVSLGLLASATHQHIPIWQNDSTLFGHAAELDERNYIAQNALGTNAAKAAQRALIAGENEAGQALLKQAIQRLSLATSSNPRHFEALVDLGAALILAGSYPEALGHLSLAAGLRPSDDNAQFQLALAYTNLKRLDEAEACLARLRQRNPSYPKLEQLFGAIQNLRSQQGSVPRKP